LEALGVERQEGVVEVGGAGGGAPEPHEHLERDAAEGDASRAEVGDAVVPGVADGGEDAAHESGAFDDEGARSVARRGDRRPEPRAAAARHEDVGFDDRESGRKARLHRRGSFVSALWSAPNWYAPKSRGNPRITSRRKSNGRRLTRRRAASAPRQSPAML